MMMDTEMIMRLCNAAAGLYGVVHVRHLVQVVKQYGDRQLTRKELTELLQQQLDEMHPENISDVRKFETKIAQSGMNEEARKEAEKVLNRMKQEGKDSHEYAV